MNKNTMIAAVVLLSMTWLTQPNLSAAVLDQTGCPCVICPSCTHKCKLDVKVVDAEKTGFDVEQKVICIPRVVFPWQKSAKKSCGCTGRASCDTCNNGAKTRKINVLKTVKYECPKCQYKWSTTKASGSKRSGCGCAKSGCGCAKSGCAGSQGGCASGGCSSGCCASNKTAVDHPIKTVDHTQEDDSRSSIFNASGPSLQDYYRLSK